jgi:hypothetical protein
LIDTESAPWPSRLVRHGEVAAQVPMLQKSPGPEERAKSRAPNRYVVSSPPGPFTPRVLT